jgi:glycolate dehydrogenase FAD-linked subunit
MLMIGGERPSLCCMASIPLLDDLRAALGENAVLTDPDLLRMHQRDEADLCAAGIPLVVTRPRTTEQVAAVVRAAARHGVPVVPQGARTGLAGAANAVDGAVVLSTVAMDEIREIDPVSRIAVVQPGVVNAALAAAVAKQGLWYPPDPGSWESSTIGGNVATNAGGMCCVKYGVTTEYVLGLEVVLASGEVLRTGRRTAKGVAGYDLTRLFVGSEGTLGITTKITVRLTRLPETVQTLLAAFPSIEAGGEAVSAIIASGVVPAAIEMMDALAIGAAEAAVRCEYPAGAGAVLIVELDGPVAEVEHQFTRVRGLCRDAGAFEIRVAGGDEERALIWKGRKSAFAAVGRISPAYLVQDGVIPRTALPEVLARIDDLSRESGLRVANVFHAGDGNLHPLVLFDDAEPGAGERAEELSGKILDLCVEHGGSITGEHGVGVDKARHMPRMFTGDDLDTMQMVRCAFDPAGICNPGKVFPTPRLCGEVPGVRKGVHPLVEQGRAEQF